MIWNPWREIKKLRNVYGNLKYEHAAALVKAENAYTKGVFEERRRCIESIKTYRGKLLSDAVVTRADRLEQTAKASVLAEAVEALSLKK